MFLKSPDGKIDVKVLIFSNLYAFGSLIGECRKQTTNQTSTKKQKKDPEENLGNVIATLDTDRIERGVDFVELNDIIDGILKDKKIDYKTLFSDAETVALLCKSFDLQLKDLISLLIERKPDVFNILFLRSVIRPFISKVKEDKYNYENETELCTGYQPIFEFF